MPPDGSCCPIVRIASRRMSGTSKRQRTDKEKKKKTDTTGEMSHDIELQCWTQRNEEQLEGSC